MHRGTKLIPDSVSSFGTVARHYASSKPFQPPISPARLGAATDSRLGAVQALPRADVALGEQLSSLRFDADQVIRSKSGHCQF